MQENYITLLQLILNKKLFEEDLLSESLYLKTEKYLLKHHPNLHEFL